MIDFLKDVLFQASGAEIFWDFIRFFVFPSTVSFGVATYTIYRESKARRRIQRRSILSFYRALLETDLPILKNYLENTSGEFMPMPLAPLPVEVSLNELTMCHEENQFMADRFAQQLILRSHFIDKAVKNQIDRKSVEEYYTLTEQTLKLLRKMLDQSLKDTHNE